MINKRRRRLELCLSWWALTLLGVACGDDGELPVDDSGTSAQDGGQAEDTSEGGAQETDDMLDVADLEFIGASCTQDSDCGSLQCVTEDSTDFAGGGAPGGYCTRPCSSDDDCSGLLNGARCLNFLTGQFCVESCEPSSEQGFSEDKCHGRFDVSCTGSLDEPVCLPTCNADGACGEGSCDLLNGLCYAAPVPGEPIGAACDPDAEPDPCAGICLGVADGVGFCSGVCTIGTIGLTGACGSDGTQGSVQDAACFLVAAGSLGTGDLGFCAQSCDCTDDCAPGMSCSVLNDEVSGFIGRPGQCIPDSITTEEITMCAGGTPPGGE